MTVALAMIVKDEAEKITRCLDAARPLIDAAVVIDTGSTDGTPQVIEGWAAANGVPLTLGHDVWKSFEQNRSALMKLARGAADWLLLLDADLIVHAPDPLPDLDALDMWQGRCIMGQLDYALPFLVRASKPWKYVGVAHAYLACDVPYSEGEMEGLWVDDHSHTTQAKIERDLIVLRDYVAEHPNARREVFYLAQSYYDLDRFHEAILYYRMRAEMGGWDEEVYFSLYRLGCLLCEHVSFDQGADVLLRAWKTRPDRNEALRALAGSATSVANKIPFPEHARLFVGAGSYGQYVSPVRAASSDVTGRFAPAAAPAAMPPLPPLDRPRPRRKPRVLNGRLNPKDVTAIVVTRGNVDLAPTLAPVREVFDDVVVWNNLEREHDYMPFGRYAAIPEAKNPVIFWVDDDVVFTAFDELLAAYEPGRLVCNMDESWIDGAGYRGLVGMQGAGSLCDADVPARVWARYLAVHPWDREALVEADFVFGTLVPFTVVDLGYAVREFADDPDRLYMQPGQTQRKHAMIQRCRELLAA